MPEPLSDLWKANHGNILLATLLVILITGASILIYEQNRFVPVQFPSAESIQSQQNPTLPRPDRPQLLVRIVNAENDLGSVLVAIYSDQESFEKKQESAISQEFEITDGEAAFGIPLDMLPSEFAVAAFHDLDGDGTLDRNTIGIPVERYGFSRGARGLTGPPTFAAAKLKRPESEQLITIELK